MFRIISVIICGLLLDCEIIGKNQLVEYIGAIPEGLDPAVNIGLFDTKIYSSIYESLVSLDDDGFSIRPGLASRWQVSSDLTRYVFELKPGRLFHDGSPVNAEALVKSFHRQVQKNSTVPLFNMIENIEQLDSLTLAIQLKYPYAQFLYTLSSPLGLKAISQRALEHHGADIGHFPVGSGPFKLKKWEDHKKIVLQRNKNYSEFSGNSDELVFKDLEDFSQLEALFKSEKCDIYYSVPGYYIDRLKWLGKIEYATAKASSMVFIGFNNQDPLLKRRIVRQAILSCIDHSRLIQYILRGNSIIAEAPLPPVFLTPIEKSQFEYNLEYAKVLMKNAGLSGGLTLRFYNIERFRYRNTIIEAIRNDLQKINIQLVVKSFDTFEQLNQACRSDSAQLFLNSWQADVLGDPENFLYSLFYSTSEYNFFHYHNQRVDDWLDAARIEPDWEKRQLLYQKIVGQILEDTPAVFLYHVIPVYAYNRHKIKSLPMDPYGIIKYHQVVLYE